MSDNTMATVAEIDRLIRQHLWFDFHVYRYDGNNLIIAGSEDLSYYHTLEIIFEEVFYVSSFFQGWHSDTRKPVIEIPNEELAGDLNLKYEVEQGYQVFVIHPGDYKNDICIAAKGITYRTDTVFYYSRGSEEQKG